MLTPPSPDQAVSPLEAAMAEFFKASALMEPLRLRIWDTEGLTVTQLRLLMLVSDAPGISNAELADRLYITRPSVSALLERLERGGFLRRDISPTDRRGICIKLEDRGLRVCSQVSNEVRDYTAGLMKDLSEGDLAELQRALAKMVEAGERRRLLDLQSEDGRVHEFAHASAR
ncbi:MAG: MarR family transcriptional regulator [Dehalococcoidia bacterium]|nr:MarR family transcriptional regulator [Dehalococcoidia bacterium]